MNTTGFLGGKSNMFPLDSFEFSPITPRFILTINYTENLPALLTLFVTKKLFVTTHQYHTHLPCTGQWSLTSPKNFILFDFCPHFNP